MFEGDAEIGLGTIFLIHHCKHDNHEPRNDDLGSQLLTIGSTPANSNAQM